MAAPRSPRRVRLSINRKRLLIGKMTSALVPVARTFLGDLLDRLRQEQGGTDAGLLAGFLANGAGQSASGRRLCDDYHRRAGLRLSLQEPRLDSTWGATAATVLRLTCDPWTESMTRSFGEPLEPVLTIQLRNLRSGFSSRALSPLDEFDLVDLEQAFVLFQAYWLEYLATIATPTTGRSHDAGTAAG